MHVSRKRCAAAFAIVALLVVLAAPLPAAAVPFASDRVPLDVQYWPEGEPPFSVIIAGLKLPETVALPAIVRMPLPTNARILWVGEIDGGDGSLDVTRTFDLRRGVGGDEIVIRLTKFRDAQYEAIYRPIAVRGATVSGTLDWVQTTPCSRLGLSVRLPSGVGSVRVSPKSAGAPRLSESGEMLYTLKPLRPKAGARVPVHVTYVRGGARTEAAGREALDTNVLLVALGVALAAAVAALLLTWRKQAARGGE